MSGTGKYFDGKKPVSIPVSWEIRNDLLIMHVIESGARLPSWELKKCRQDLDQNTAFVLKNTETEESLEIEGDNSAFPKELIKDKKVSFRVDYFAGVALALVITMFAFFKSIPFLSKYVAQLVPYEQEQKLSEHLKLSDLGDIKACVPEKESQAAFDKLMKRIYPIDKDDFPGFLKVEIVKYPVSNALTFPGGRIVVFDDVIVNAKSPEELAGVIAHEIGHAKKRHIMQKIVSTLSMAAVFQFIGGDFSSALALDPSTVLSIGTLAFDRGMETEADQFAYERLVQSKINPHDVAGFFERLSMNSDKYAILSSHPGDESRIKLFRSKNDVKALPILTKKEWQALKDYCLVKPKLVKPLIKVKAKAKNDPIRSEPQGDLRSRFQFPQRF
jgi:Zn-dependent protease with chaperone function